MASNSSTNISFDARLAPERTSLERSRSSSRLRSEIETPEGPVQRDALPSLAVAPDFAASVVEEPAWPKGWRPYACLFGCFMLMFNSWGLVNAYGTYASYYMQHLLPGRDVLLLNLIGSTQSFVVLALSAVVGRFLDAGHSRQLAITGTVFVSLGMFLFSIVNGGGHYDQGSYGLIWLTQGFICGLGMACFFVSSSQVASTWFKKKKGFAIGVVASGASIAGLVYPVMTKFLITMVGFNDTVRYVATVVAVTSILVVIFARPNPAHPLNTPNTWRKVRTFVDTAAFRNTPFVWFTTAICFLFFGFYAVFFNLEEWAASEGLGYKDDVPSGVDIGLKHEVHDDAIRTFYLLAIMNGCSTLGRVGSSYLCDHFGALNVHAAVTSIASVLILVLWTQANTVSSAIAFVVVFGAFSGAVIGLPPACVSVILGEGAQAKLGQWTGLMYTCAAVFALTGPVIAGPLISEYGNNYLTVQLWSGTCLLLSACCMCMAIIYHERPSASEWVSEKVQRLSSSVNSAVNTQRRQPSSEKEDV